MKQLRFPRLNRRQRVARNFTIAAAALFLIAWMLEFPAWSKENLMRRTERQYLLTGSTLAYSAEDDYWGHELYIRNRTRFLVATYSPTPLGLSPGWTRYIDQPLYATTHWHNVTDILALSAADAPAAELTAALRVKNSDGYWLEETYQTQGQRLGEGVFRFVMEPHYEQGDDSAAAQTERKLFAEELIANEWTATIRYYDDAGELMGEEPVTHLNHDHWAW
ncbi:MAG: hypothetical protein PUC45_08210 [Oscillospiraceae bacterium]|nr:hypothetical protein [Oscillospiraceae bacterium]